MKKVELRFEGMRTFLLGRKMGSSCRNCMEVEFLGNRRTFIHDKKFFQKSFFIVIII